MESVDSNTCRPDLPRFGARDLLISVCLILFPARWPASKQSRKFLWDPGLSNRIGHWEKTRPQEKRQRNIRWVQDAGRDSAVSPRSGCGEGQGRGPGTADRTPGMYCGRIPTYTRVHRLVQHEE